MNECPKDKIKDNFFKMIAETKLADRMVEMDDKWILSNKTKQNVNWKDPEWMSPELLHYDWDGTKHNGMIAEEIDPATETIEFRPSSDDDATLDEDESIRTQNCEVQEAVPMEEDPPPEPVQDNPASIPLPEDNDPKDTPAPINDVQTTTIPDTPKAASDKESEHHTPVRAINNVVTPTQVEASYPGLPASVAIQNAQAMTYSEAAKRAPKKAPEVNSFLELKKCKDIIDSKLNADNSQSTGEVGNTNRELVKVQVGLWVPPGDDNYANVTQCINNFLNKCNEIEGGNQNSVKLAKFKETVANKDLLTELGKAKYKAEEIEEYTSNVKNWKKTNFETQYMRLNLSLHSDVDLDSLIKELNSGNGWGDRPKQFIRKAPSQSKDPVLIGFLLRSNWVIIDSPDFEDFHKHQSGLTLGFQNRQISFQGRSYDSSKDGNHKKAIYVECEKSEIKKAFKYCRSEFPSSQKTKTPSLGIKCAFIATVDDSGRKLKPNKKLEESCIKQQIATSKTLFVHEKHTGFLTSKFDYELPFPDGTVGTMRQFLATYQTLPDEDGVTRDLFQIVSISTKPSGLHLVMLKPHAEEGRHVIKALPQVVATELHLQDLSDFFTEEAIEECREGVWDPQLRLFRNLEEIANEQAVVSNLADIPGLAEAMDEESKQVKQEGKQNGTEKMTGAEMKNYMRAVQGEDETVTNVPPMERTIAVLGPNGTTPGRQAQQATPATPTDAINVNDNETAGSSLTGNTRESKVQLAIEKTRGIYEGAMKEVRQKHKEEMQKRDTELEEIKKQLAAVMGVLNSQNANPGAGQSASNG